MTTDQVADFMSDIWQPATRLARPWRPSGCPDNRTAVSSTACDIAGAMPMRILATIQSPEAIRAILECLDLPPLPPPIAPPALGSPLLAET